MQNVSKRGNYRAEALLPPLTVPITLITGSIILKRKPRYH